MYRIKMEERCPEAQVLGPQKPVKWENPDQKHTPKPTLSAALLGKEDFHKLEVIL